MPVHDPNHHDAYACAMRKNLAELAAWSDASAPIPRRLEPVGVELDGLAQVDAPDEFGSLYAENLAAMRAIVPDRRVAILGMARNEGTLLVDWVCHHLAIGVEHIFVYTNDNDDGTDRLLNWLADVAPVTPIFTTCASGVNIQRKNYQHALTLVPHMRRFEWILVLDVDEFLVPAQRHDHSIRGVLDAAPEWADAVLFPWKVRMTDFRFERQAGKLDEQFPNAFHFSLFKPAVRWPRLDSLAAVHAPSLAPGGRIVDTAFREIPPDEVWDSQLKSDAGGWIDHYWARSFEEFVLKKHRGEALAIPTGEFKRDLASFFDWTPDAQPEHRKGPDPLLDERVRAQQAAVREAAGYADMHAMIEARYLELVTPIRGDAALRAEYEALRAARVGSSESNA